jgi:hypothetical protein
MYRIGGITLSLYFELSGKQKENSVLYFVGISSGKFRVF